LSIALVFLSQHYAFTVSNENSIFQRCYISIIIKRQLRWFIRRHHVVYRHDMTTKYNRVIQQHDA